jgi:hypothetical protein
LPSDIREVEVEVTRLDSDFPLDVPIRLLKIDAEGFEHHVLRGASRLLERRCIDIIMLECIQALFGEAWGEFVGELRKLISCGYSPYTLGRNSKLRATDLNEILYSYHGRNVVFVSQDAAETIRELS